jgi:serine/threonine-protein kinase
MESGQTIAGKYRLNQILGTGGMATVWSATNVFTDRQFAIKFLLPTFAKTEEAARRFLQEAKISGKIHHPNVIQIMDVGQAEDGALFLVMELLAGVNLEVAMRRQTPPMTIYEFIGVMLDVARALSAAHRAGVVHRDLKPSNIYMHKDRDGVAVPKVLDFGVSKFLLEEDRNAALTVAGTVLGSPLYMSPEQARGVSDIDHRTDIFAFGAILFEGLTGLRCFDAPNFNALIVTIATQQPKSIDATAPHLSEGLRAVVRDCTQTDRDKRIATFDQIIERLAALLPELEQSPLRLPAPIGQSSGGDPDATNAMPAIVRPSDRAPSFHPTSEQSPAPWAGNVPAAAPPSRGDRKVPVLPFAIAGVLLACLLVAGVLFAAVWMQHKQTPIAATAAPSATVTAPIVPSARPSASATVEAPVVSVNALPFASASSAAKPKGHGFLNVTAKPTWCNVSIDGRPVGATPIANFEVSSGSHLVKCEPESGKSQTFPVVVYDGQKTSYTFNLNP